MPSVGRTERTDRREGTVEIRLTHAQRLAAVALSLSLGGCTRIPHPPDDVLVGAWRVSEASDGPATGSIQLLNDHSCTADDAFITFVIWCNGREGMPPATSCGWGRQEAKDTDEIQLVLDTDAGFVGLRTFALRLTPISTMELHGQCVSGGEYGLVR
jgi:hypothetical protein